MIATSSSDEKLAQARELGADAVINYRQVKDWSVRAAEIAGGEGVDLVVEVGGSGTLDQALQAVRPGGEVALVGVLTGFGGPVNTAAILMTAVNLRGVYVGSVADLARAMGSGVRPIIGASFPFEQADAAYELMRRGGHRGKIAIQIADDGGQVRRAGLRGQLREEPQHAGSRRPALGLPEPWRDHVR